MIKEVLTEWPESAPSGVYVYVVSADAGVLGAFQLYGDVPILVDANGAAFGPADFEPTKGERLLHLDTDALVEQVLREVGDG